MKFEIYVLYNNKENEIKYVGITRHTSKERLKAHLYETKYITNKVTHKHKWIRKVKYKVNVLKIDEAYSMKDAIELEQFYIGYFKMIGCKLCNTLMHGEINPMDNLETKYKSQSYNRLQRYNKIKKYLKHSEYIDRLTKDNYNEIYYEALYEYYINRNLMTKEIETLWKLKRSNIRGDIIDFNIKKSDENKSICLKRIQSKYKKIIDKDILNDLYINKNKSMLEISIILNTSFKSVLRNCQKYNLYKWKKKKSILAPL